MQKSLYDQKNLKHEKQKDLDTLNEAHARELESVKSSKDRELNKLKMDLR